MNRNYQSDYYDFLRSLEDREDELTQREEEQRQKGLRLLAERLSQSFEILRYFERKGVTIVTNGDDILAVLKEVIPEVWSVPQAKPLIDFVFSTSL